MSYDPTTFAPFAVTVDLVVLTIRKEQLCALVVRRGEAPFRGHWALPGGFAKIDEDLADAAARELEEETGLSPEAVHVEQLGTFGQPGRDPRMRVVSVAHLALAPDLPAPRAGTDAAAAQFVPVAELQSDSALLAFDHAEILEAGVERARAKLEYSSLGAAFCQAEFTVAELRRVYEIVWGTTIDARNFHRKATKTHGFLEPVGSSTTRDGGRPALLYRRGSAQQLQPPLTRPRMP